MWKFWHKKAYILRQAARDIKNYCFYTKAFIVYLLLIIFFYN